jgi:hypothetical protein
MVVGDTRATAWRSGRTSIGFVNQVKQMSPNANGNPLLPVLKNASMDALILDYFLLDDLFEGATRARLVDRCERDLRGARLKLLIGDPFLMLRTVLRRLNVLRNRVMHGCVTYGAVSKGLPSVVKGARVARSVVPALCELMALHGPIVKWDPIPYPRVGFEDPREKLDAE